MWPHSKSPANWARVRRLPRSLSPALYEGAKSVLLAGPERAPWIAGWGRVTQREAIDERLNKAPRNEVDASLRDLIVGSKELPWTQVIFKHSSVNGQMEANFRRLRSHGSSSMANVGVF